MGAKISKFHQSVKKGTNHNAKPTTCARTGGRLPGIHRQPKQGTKHKTEKSPDSQTKDGQGGVRKQAKKVTKKTVKRIAHADTGGRRTDENHEQAIATNVGPNLKSQSTNYYTILGVPMECSGVAIDVAYQRAWREHCADSSAYPERFKPVEQAYKVLSNVQQRMKYDEAITGPRPMRVWRPGEYGHPALRPTSEAFLRKHGESSDSTYDQFVKMRREAITWD